MIRPTIVLGPPGTGKTTTLLDMVDEEISRGTEPSRIGYVSFTRRAAHEARDRAAEKFGLDAGQMRWFRTLHSLCFEALGLSNSDVFEGAKLREFGEWLGVQLTSGRLADDGIFVPYTAGDRALFMHGLSRVRGVSLREQYETDNDGLPWSLVDRVGRNLERFKTSRHLVDYTDMLRLFAEGGWAPDLDVLFVDEAQDLSALQWRVVERLARGVRRWVVAGDDDQAIYRWAGADVEHFLDLEGDVRVLGQSWRCPGHVRDLALGLVGRIERRRPKEWRPRETDEGRLMRVRHLGEVDFWGEDVMVLARNNFLLEDVADFLRDSAIVYEIGGKSSVPREILSAVRTWETLRAGGEVTADDARVVYEWMRSGSGVARGHKKLPQLGRDDVVTLAWLREHGGLRTDVAWYEALERIPIEHIAYLRRARARGEATTGKVRVRLSSIHQAKGGEADHVVLLTDVATRTHREMRHEPDDEARVWYVAATRARTDLTIVAPDTGRYYDL